MTDTGAGDGGGGEDVGAWFTGLPEDVRTNPAMAAFEGKPLGDLVTEHVNLQGLIGRKGAIPPGEGATPEQWATFDGELQKILPEARRVPESADKYDLGDFAPAEGLPWNEEVQTAMMGVMHAQGLNSAQAKGLMAGYSELRAAEFKAINDTLDQNAAATTAALKREWGADYDGNRALGERALKSVFGENMQAAMEMKLANGNLLFDEPLLAQAFHTIGKAFGEDGVLPGGGGGGGGGGAENTPAGAKAAKDKIYADARSDPKHPFNDRGHPEHKAINDRILALNRVIHPGASGAM